MKNPYKPYPVRIKRVEIATEDKSLRTFEFEFINKEDAKKFNYMPGQFAELSIPGYGESPIGIASSPTEGENLLFTVFRIGKVTTKLHSMKEGDVMGVRGPLGHPYPLKELEGKNIVIIAGGYAVTTLRSTMVCSFIQTIAQNMEKLPLSMEQGHQDSFYITINGESGKKRDDVDCHITIDREVEGWDGLVGFVPTITEQVAPNPDNSVAIICGPPVMIKFTQPVLDKLGWKGEQIIMSLENRMKCGIGICGRCNVGPYYVCKDGPVFTKAQLDNLPKEY